MIEITVTLVLSAIVAASLAGVVYSLGQNAGDAGRNADVQRTARLVMAEIVIDLRQAQAVTENGDPIASLNADRVVFYTDRDQSEGPERVIYERTSCAAGLCELRVTRYAAVAGTGPDWVFESLPYEEQVMMERVLGDQPLFRGAAWVGSPPAKTFVSTCSGTCTFPLVVIRLGALPEVTSAGATRTLEILEEVELRNAG